MMLDDVECELPYAFQSAEILREKNAGMSTVVVADFNFISNESGMLKCHILQS